MSFVSVPRDQFTSFMTHHGFQPSTEGRELTFVRSNRACPNLKMIVYSSIPVTGDAGRGYGQDAIRVCLVWFPEKGDSQGVESTARVYRTGSNPKDYSSVLRRLKERMLGMAKEAEDMLKTRCGHCGGPTYSDSGRCRIMACRKAHRDAKPVKLPPNEVIAAEAAREEQEMHGMEAKNDREQSLREEKAKADWKAKVEGQF